MNTKRSNPTERSFIIEHGPSKDRLFDACKYAYSRNSHIEIDFGIGDENTGDPKVAYIPIPTCDFKIFAIEHEDGSGGSFNLQGCCRVNLNGNDQNPKHFETCNFSAFYSSHNRRGRITFYI